MPTYRSNPRNTGQGTVGTVWGQSEVEEAQSEGTVIVFSSSGNSGKTRYIGNQNGAAQTAKYGSTIIDHKDRPDLFRDVLIGRSAPSNGY